MMVQRLMSRFYKNYAYSVVNTQPHKYLSNVAVYGAQQYDRDCFNKVITNLHQNPALNMQYYSQNLDMKSAILSQGCDTVCIFVNDKADAQVLNLLKKNGIETIALRCAGFNNVDLKEAAKLGIKVVRVPAYSPHAVAEFSMTLLLALNRKVHKAYNRTREGNFQLDGLLGFNLYGCTVGIVGTGKIGQCFGSICKGFGMNILCYDPIKVSAMENIGAKYVDLDKLLKESDVISLHCPLTPETFHLINDESLKIIKNNAIILNTGRGGLIDSKSVIKALKSGKLGGLGMDVYEQEERLFFKDQSSHIMQDDKMARLLSLNNVVVTGHQAFFTKEALQNICETTIHNIIDIKLNSKSNNEIIHQ